MNPLVTEARALCEGATKGPWKSDDYGMMVWATDPYRHGDMRIADVRGWGHLTGGGDGACGFSQEKGGEIQDANMNLITRARTLLPEMADEIERLQAELDALKADIEAAGSAIALIEDWIVVAEPYKGVMDIIDKWKKRREALAAMKEDARG